MKKILFLELILCATIMAAISQAGSLYQSPAGGWMYIYDGLMALPGTGGGASGIFDSLDGTWNRGNGSDMWDQSDIGTGAPGGVSALTEGGVSYIRIQDPGDPRDYAMPDPSNRKVYLGHDITAHGASSTILNDGATLNFRARVTTAGPLDNLYPDGGGGIAPWPAGGDGYLIHDGGKGNFGIKQAAGGIVSFSLATAGDTGGLAGLLMNNLNGTAVTGDVDSGEAGTVNLLALDPTVWHEFWITIKGGGAGTHQVSVYQDGSLVPTVFDVTTGNGNDYNSPAISYLGLGAGATGQAGALDIDFFAVASGAIAPIPEPSTVGLLGLGATLLWWLRRRSAR